MKHFAPKIALLAIPFALFACGDDPADDLGEGTLEITAYGEPFVEEGIPAEEVSDGWAIDFDAFVVTIEDFTIADVEFPDAGPVDLSASSDGGGHELTSATVPAGDHTGADFVITQVEVQGSATKDEQTKTFDWTFDEPATYAHCHGTATVEDGETAKMEITIHADHLFFDSLVADAPEMTFDLLAKADDDGDGDGEITQAELEAADIGALDPGNEHIHDLWSWLLAQSANLGHINGEEHCHAASNGHHH